MEHRNLRRNFDYQSRVILLAMRAAANAVPNARINNYAFKYVEALSRWGSNLGLTLSSPGPFVLTLGDNLRQIH